MFKSILLPIDLNYDASWQKALPTALDLLEKSGGTLHLLGILPDFGTSLVASYFPPDFEVKAAGGMEAALQSFADEKLPLGLTTTLHVGQGGVRKAILDTATEISADLIVMASHPPDLEREFLVGSNADRVVRRAPMSVLVVR